MTNLNFEAISALCAEKDYSGRIQFVATAKEPTLRLKLVSGIDSLQQAKAFVARLEKYLQL